MPFDIAFEPLTIGALPALSSSRKEEGWRFVQILAVNTEDGIDLEYTFMKDGHIVNSKIEGVQKNEVVPSITEDFLEAFVFENEIHELFGVQISDIAIDFEGNFYDLAQNEPMTVISPEQKAAREKAKKLEAAKKAKAAKAAAAKAQAGKDGGAGDAAPAAEAPAVDAELEAKLAGMDPEKAAKVRAAMEAKAKKAAAAKSAAPAEGAGKEGD